MAFITEDTTAQTMAHMLYHHYFYIFGTALCLMTDNDLAFTRWGGPGNMQLIQGEESVH